MIAALVDTMGSGSIYETQFGCVSEYFQEDFYLHLLQPESKVQLAFMVPEHPSQPEFLQPVVSAEGMVISLEVTDAKAAHEQARQSQMNIVFDYLEEEFGVAHFVVKDPAGLVIDVVEHLQHQSGWGGKELVCFAPFGAHLRRCVQGLDAEYQQRKCAVDWSCTLAWSCGSVLSASQQHHAQHQQG